MRKVGRMVIGVALLSACVGSRAVTRPPAIAASRGAKIVVPATTTTVTPKKTEWAGALDAVLVNTNSCLLVTDASTNRILYSHQADVAFTPASTQKLLVAAAALSTLGPDYRFTTTVVALHAPLAGVVEGLWMVGGGDPLLASPEYAALLQTSPVTSGYPTTPVAALADQLVRHGVRVVLGGIHGDDSRYDRQRTLPTWGPTINHGEFDIGPLGALEVDQGLDRWRPAVPTQDPAGHGAGVLARLLNGRGVRASEGADAAAPRHAVVLATVQSAPLAVIVEAMLRASDNQIAELLVREIDRHAGGLGTTAAGVQRVIGDVAALGVPTAGLHLVDGSGLSDADHATCRTLLAALDLGDQPRFDAMKGGLSVAGVSGSLTDVFRDTPLAGRLAAKGGYIEGVTALVGRTDARRFAFVANGALPYLIGLALSERVAEAVAA